MVPCQWGLDGMKNTLNENKISLEIRGFFFFKKGKIFPQYKSKEIKVILIKTYFE